MTNSSPESRFSPDEVNSYLNGFRASEHYSKLTDDEKEKAEDIIYYNKIVPYYKQHGQEPPQRNSFATKAPLAKSERPSFKIGIVKGAAKIGLGVASLSQKALNLELELIDSLLKTDLRKGGAGRYADKTISRIDKLEEGVDSFYSERYGEASTIGDSLKEIAGEAGIQLPIFIASGAALKGVPALSALSEGKLLAHGQLLQKVAFTALDAAAAAPLIGQEENIPEFAAAGGGLHLGFAALGKAFKIVGFTLGKEGLGKVLNDSVASAKAWKGKPRASANNPLADIAEANAANIEGISQDKFGKSFKDLDDTRQTEVVSENMSNVRKAIFEESDDDVVEELASIDYDEAIVSNPVASSIAERVAAVASKAGAATPAELFKKTAVKQVRQETTQSALSTTKPEVIPEATSTIMAQIDSLIDGTKRAVVLMPGQAIPKDLKIPDKFIVKGFKDGVKVIFNKEAISGEKVAQAKLRNALDEILDYPASKQDVADAVAQGEEAVIVKATDTATGAENSSVVASTSTVLETVAQVKKEFPKAEVVVAKADDSGLIDRVRKTIDEEYEKLFTPKIVQFFKDGKDVVLSKEDKGKLALVRQAAVKAGVPEAEVDTMMKAASARMKESIGSVKGSFKERKVGTTKASEPGSSTGEAKTISSAKVDKKEAQEASAVLNYEKRDSGINDLTYRRVLEQFGFTTSKLVPKNLVEEVRQAILRASINENRFSSDADGLLTAFPKGEKAVKVTGKVLDIDTEYNPTFIKDVGTSEHVEVIGSNAVETFNNLAGLLGEQGVKDWLISKGYQAIKTGRQGKGEDLTLQPLVDDIVQDVAKKEAKEILTTAKAVGFPAKEADKGSEAIDKIMREVESLKVVVEKK